jgi:hypothetical protein
VTRTEACRIPRNLAIDVDDVDSERGERRIDDVSVAGPQRSNDRFRIHARSDQDAIVALFEAGEQAAR